MSFLTSDEFNRRNWKKQGLDLIKAAIYSALIIGLVVAPWFFLPNA